jgi:hypothetical protein
MDSACFCIRQFLSFSSSQIKNVLAFSDLQGAGSQWRWSRASSVDQGEQLNRVSFVMPSCEKNVAIFFPVTTRPDEKKSE